MHTPSALDAGFLVMDDVLHAEQCGQLLAQIDRFRQQHSLTEVYRPMKSRPLRYQVIDGEQIRQHLPAIWELYQGPILPIVQRAGGPQLRPLANTRVGVNVNIMTPGRSAYRWHYDRTSVTAVLYLNQVQGGEIEMYPNYRILLQDGRMPRVQRLLDGLLRPRVVRRAFGAKVAISPEAGRLVIMRGRRCWHSVRSVEGDQDRINIVLAYDHPHAAFPMEMELDRYLYSNEQTESSDPNYAA